MAVLRIHVSVFFYNCQIFHQEEKGIEVHDDVAPILAGSPPTTMILLTNLHRMAFLHRLVSFFFFESLRFSCKRRVGKLRSSKFQEDVALTAAGRTANTMVLSHQLA